MGTFLHRTYVGILGRPHATGKFGCALVALVPERSARFSWSFARAICQRMPTPLGRASYFPELPVVAARRLAWPPVSLGKRATP
jgi:hypothetical protein